MILALTAEEGLEVAHSWRSDELAPACWPPEAKVRLDQIPDICSATKAHEIVRFEDAAEPGGSPRDRRFLQELGLRSAIAIPIAVGGAWMGLAIVGRREAGRYDETDELLLKLVGQVIASAMARRATEHELTRRVSNYRIVLNVVPDLVMSHTGGRITYINPAGADMLGVDAHELQGKPVLDLIQESHRAAVKERIERNLAGEDTNGVSELFVRADGSTVPVEVSARRFDYFGSPSVLVIARDLSQRLDALERERATTGLLRSTLESTDDGILAIDLEGRVQAHNTRLLEIWNLPRRSLEGASEYDFLQPALRLIQTSDEFLQRWQDLHRDRGLTVSGTLELVDGRTLSMHSTPQLVEGEPAGRVWSFGDITSQKEAERALEESAERFRLLFERNLAGVYRSTTDGTILDCNAACARILGFSSKFELQGTNAAELYYDAEERNRLLDELRSRGAFTNKEICFRRKDGSPVWVLESATLLAENSQMEGTLIDISEIKRVEAGLRESEERYRLMTQYSSDLISRLTPDWIFTYVSQAATEILGYHPEELVGRSLRDLVHPEDLEEFDAQVESATESEEIRHVFRIRSREESFIWFEAAARPIRSEYTGDVVERVAVIRDVSEAREAQAKIEHQAYHDPLTGLPNRMLFLDRLSVAIASAPRAGKNVCVMFLDLDNFKFINDTLGHSVGDGLLERIAKRLSDTVRAEDTVSRMGGDEFTILSQLSSSDDARTLARKILDVVTEPIYVDGHELFVTTSIGVAIYPDDGEDRDTLLKNADTAMYRAKALGRNNFQLCTDEMNARAIERLSLEKGLRRAVEGDELVVFYQPQIDMQTGKIFGNEALVRWQHPDLGLLGPDEFISIAEETRLIFSLGEFVLREACRQTVAWHEEGAKDLRISVNLSVRQFQHRAIVERIRSILEETGLRPNLLDLEITESIAMQNMEWTSEVLRKLRDLGVTITMDDFGTGYSSLNHLRRFSVDVLKIDRSFVADIVDNKVNHAIVSAIIQLGKGMGMHVIAEGVETESQRLLLTEYGCMGMQGYLFSRPVPGEEAGRLLRHNLSL